MANLTFDQFVAQLRSALHPLYDPDELRRSPLASSFGIAGGFDSASALQRILTEAVEALQPPADEPPQSRAWRIYDALVYRYVRGFDRDVVADQLGISGRQLRREQRAALEVLADHLWRQYDLAAKAAITSPPGSAVQPALEPGDEAAAAPAWLRDLPPEKPAALGQVLQATLDLARPLARQWQVRLESTLAEEASGVAVPQAALRHALLSILGVAIPHAQAGEVTIAVALAGGNIEVSVTSVAPAGHGSPLSEQEQASLDVARQLAGVAGGALALGRDNQPFGARLILPALHQIPVLVVDDNADILQLFGRYVSGTRYCLTGTRDPGQALRLAEELDPQVIVLDVMMPEVDGWELLAQLRREPATAEVAIVICTVLPQEALALALGADAFLQKPVSREALLATLGRLTEAQLDPEG